MTAGGRVGGTQGRAANSRIQAYRWLREAVADGRLLPGQALRELQVAEWTGVSRTPVREALQRLELEGVLRREGQDLVVRRRSPEEILDVYSTRILLEGAAAGCAAERRTEHDLMQLRWALARGSEAVEGDVAAMVDTNKAFNRRIWRAAHNDSLVDLLDRLTVHLARYPETTLVSPGRWAQSQANHAALLAAVEARDPERARTLAAEHFTQAREIRLALFAREDLDLGGDDRFVP